MTKQERDELQEKVARVDGWEQIKRRSWSARLHGWRDERVGFEIVPDYPRDLNAAMRLWEGWAIGLNISPSLPERCVRYTFAEPKTIYVQARTPAEVCEQLCLAFVELKETA